MDGLAGVVVRANLEVGSFFMRCSCNESISGGVELSELIVMSDAMFLKVKVDRMPVAVGIDRKQWRLGPPQLHKLLMRAVRQGR
jgi:hypothetical protein